MLPIWSAPVGPDLKVNLSHSPMSTPEKMSIPPSLKLPWSQGVRQQLMSPQTVKKFQKKINSKNLLITNL